MFFFVVFCCFLLFFVGFSCLLGGVSGSFWAPEVIPKLLLALDSQPAAALRALTALSAAGHEALGKSMGKLQDFLAKRPEERRFLKSMWNVNLVIDRNTVSIHIYI